MNKPFGLYMIMTDPLIGYEKCAEIAVRHGVRYLQLRMKYTDKETVLNMAREIRNITKESTTGFIVNDYVDIAVRTDADGVHLGQADTAVTEARKSWNNPEKIFGLSTHNTRQEKRAREIQPDYIGVGPVFPTPTKAVPDPVLGLETMGAIIRSSPLPAVAIGGITPENLKEVLMAGTENFCAVRPVMQSKNPGEVIERMQDIWQAFYSIPQKDKR